MIQTTQVCHCLFILILMTAVARIHPSLYGHNNEFVQDDSDVQYLLDSLPESMHKGFSSSSQESGTSLSEENEQDYVFHIEFEPNILDFKERQLGVPHQETVTLFNRDNNRTVHLSSISGNTQHFHSSFFQDKVIPPLGNTTFNVVFLGREEGEIDSYLFVHTSDGTLKYQVKGVSISSPYRLQPIVGVKLPINASFTPLIYMHNPHSEPMQIIEIYSSGKEFQLELPSGEVEGPRELWEIPPYQTKPVIRLHFNAYTEKNHTAYIRFKLNNSAEVLIVAVEIEVNSGAGLHWGDSSGIVNFGIGGSYQPPVHYHIALKNSAKKPVKVQNIISTPTSKALKINFEPTVIPGDTNIPIIIGSLVYNWKAGLDLKHLKGKLLIKGIGPGGSSQKLAIPWMAKVLDGGLEVNTSAAHYCSPHSSQPRNFSVINKFKLPLAITNVFLPLEAAPFFSISNFFPKILQPGLEENLFTLSLKVDKKHENLQLKSSILIHSNVSTTEVPLLSYNGKLHKLIPGGRISDKGAMNFGTVSSGSENEGIFALDNQNPVNIELHGWGVNMPGAVLELMGCQNSPIELFNKELQNTTACSATGNQSVKPGHSAVFKIKVKTPYVEEDTIVGDVFIKTTYERLTIPVYMKVAHGEISMKQLTFTNCFPGSICLQQVKVHSTFARDMEVTFLAPTKKDDRIKFISSKENSNSVISKGPNHIGSIEINPLTNCKQQCYLGLSLNSSAGSQWLNTFSLPSHTRDSDLNLLNTRYLRFLNVTSGRLWENISMQLDTSEVRGYKFSVNIKPCWPSVIIGLQNEKDKTVLVFPLTQVGNNSFKTIKLHNPTIYQLFIHLVMDWSYPHGMRLFHLLPNKFKPKCLDCPNTVYGEFKLDGFSNEREVFEKEWGIVTAPHTIAVILEPNKTKTMRLSYTPSAASSSSALLYIRNNMTIIEVVRLTGRGAHAQFKFGNLNPGSKSPLLFELTEKHLKDCEIERNRQNPLPNLTVKRSFTARNTGELPIEAYSFFINGLACEGYGFKILNCVPFTLLPNATQKIEIAFTPDFTLSRIERNLFIKTSLGLEMDEDLHQENGLVKLTLVTTVPSHTLEACASLIARPSWESAVQWTACGLTIILLVCILAAAFLEADRILRGALINMSRGNPTQPPLDLRMLSHSTSLQPSSFQTNIIFNKSKFASRGDELIRSSIKANKKDDLLPDWNFMNVKRNKEKYFQKRIKIPDWSINEERKFRTDIEVKDNTSMFKKCVTDSINFEGGMNNLSGLKKRGKRSHNSNDSRLDIYMQSMDMQVSDKKNIPIPKSSPSSNGKSKSCGKQDILKQFFDHTIHSGLNKRKQSTENSSSVTNSQKSCKKYDSSTSQKVTHYSEEETSSTTTESSVQEDNNVYKKCENNSEMAEKIQRKSTLEKSQSIHDMPSLDFKDYYEGDCDDDDYDKEKHNNPNRWKTNTARSGNRHLSRLNIVSTSKVPRQKPNPQRKEKPFFKRRNVDKSQPKAMVTNGITFQKDDMKALLSIPSPSLPPPPSLHWGENRAKFSDVVARNQDNFSAFANHSNRKLHKTASLAVPETFGVDFPDSVKRKPTQDFVLNEYRLRLPSVPIDKEKTSINSDILGIKSNHSNSYFVNTFKEPPFEPQLTPYGDLPESDKLLLDFERTDKHTHQKFWDDNNSVINPEKSTFQMNNPAEKILNLSDTLKDDWTNVQTNFQPFYARGAVGEERSGVWGINTGGVWAASPWGSPTPSQSTAQSTIMARSRELISQEHTDFDPFRSFNTIWTPTLDSWTSKQKE